MTDDQRSRWGAIAVFWFSDDPARRTQPFRIMHLPCAGLWLFATALSFLTASEPVSPTATVEIVAGPWLELDRAGGLVVKIALANPAPANPTIVLIDGTGARFTARSTASIAINGRNCPVLAMGIPSTRQLPGPFRIDGPWKRAPTGTIPDFLGLRRQGIGVARLAFAGPEAWPDQGALDRLGVALGGTIEAVVALGSGWRSQVAVDGWTANLPVLLPEEDGNDDRTVVERWGVIALPVLHAGSDLPSAFAGLNAPWTVPLDLGSCWDLSLTSTNLTVPDLRGLIDLCNRQRLPLILGGSAAGFISEPMGIDATRHQVISAGGVRWITARCGGAGLAQMPTPAAQQIPGAALIGLAADGAKLRFAAISRDPVRDRGATDIILDWDRPNPGKPGTGSGWGTTDLPTIRPPDLAVAPAEVLDRIALLPAPVLDLIRLSQEEAAKLCDRAAADAAAGRLLQRLTNETAVEDLMRPQPGGASSRVPAGVLRTVVLRDLAAGTRARSERWLQAAARSPDPELAKALLRAAEVDRDPIALSALVTRLEGWADGSLTPDPDAVVQHRFAAAVFDSPTLSPTGLRPLAAKLKLKLAVAAQPPIDRFLARHGLVRPVK